MKSKPTLPKVITQQLAVACSALGFFAYHPYAASAQEVKIINGAEGWESTTYLHELQKKLKIHWSQPNVPTAGNTVIVFGIREDGTIVTPRLTEHSTNRTVDSAALKTLTDAAPLAPLPKGAPSSIEIELTFAPKARTEAYAEIVEIGEYSNCDPVYLNNQGVIAINAGRYKEAIRFLKSSLKHRPDYKIARENLAIAYNNLAKTMRDSPDEAIAYLELAVKYDSTNGIAQRNLIELQKKKREREQAELHPKDK